MSDELKWNWAYAPYLDPPEKQKESALKAGYIKVVNKSEADKVIAELDKKHFDDLQNAEDSFKSVLELNRKEFRMLCRALWLARTRTARYAKMFWEKNVILNEPLYFTIDCRCYEKGMKEQTLRPSEWAKVWMNVERKCRAKAEEYK